MSLFVSHRFVSFPEIVRMENKIPFRVKMETLHKSGVIPNTKIVVNPCNANTMTTTNASTTTSTTTTASTQASCSQSKVIRPLVSISTRISKDVDKDLNCDSAKPLGCSHGRETKDEECSKSWGELSAQNYRLTSTKRPRMNQCAPSSVQVSQPNSKSKHSSSLCLSDSTVPPVVASNLLPTMVAFPSPLLGRGAKTQMGPLHFWNSLGPSSPAARFHPSLAPGAEHHFQFPLATVTTFGSLSPFGFPPPTSPCDSFSSFVLSARKPISVIH